MRRTPRREATKLPGVENADVNIATEKMTVRFDEQKLGFAELKKAVEDAGYGLVALDEISKELYVSPQYFSRLYKHLQGITIKELPVAILQIALRQPLLNVIQG